MTVRHLLVVAVMLWAQIIAAAHSGPPYPIVTERAVGRYVVSIWTEPDATDDRSAGGQFWVVFHEADGRPAAATA